MLELSGQRSVTLVAGARLVARGASRVAYHFEGAAPPQCFDLPDGSPTLGDPLPRPIVS